MTYAEFLAHKQQDDTFAGFDPGDLPAFLFDFQRDLVTWALRKGKSALFCGCGLGKGPMGLVWADRVAERTDKPVLILAPLGVSYQFVAEGEKFGFDVRRVQDGAVPAGARIVVTNYERIERFDPTTFGGAVCDESSCLKSFAGQRRVLITEFMRRMPFRLLATATPSPNDYIELGTSSEALGYLGHMDMLSRFFINTNGNSTSLGAQTRHNRGDVQFKWRFRGHAEVPFWRWVCSWARAVRRPSDLGYDDGAFVLPPLDERYHTVVARTKRPGFLFDIPAVSLEEEREERRRTLHERCEKVAELVERSDAALVWCHLNPEGDLLTKLIPGAVQVAGKDSDDAKEAKLLSFQRGQVRVLVTKPKIGAWGLNLQRCAHVVTFPSHSYEQTYQGVRRCWRFGQTRTVRLDTVATDGEARIVANQQRKSEQADRMFDALVGEMNRELRIKRLDYAAAAAVEKPAWM